MTETADESREARHDENPIDEAQLGTLAMFALAIVIGAFGGFGSIAFESVIAVLHNLFFYGELSAHYDAKAAMEPSRFGAGVILVPVVGAVLVTWITRNLAPEARGRGVAEVLNAIYREHGRIRPQVLLAKALASAVSIGTGGSVGREGPIIQMGSAFGSILGQLTKIPTRQCVVLIAAGAAAGIAATFNAPIGGLAFAMELLLVSISARAVALVATATVTATYIGRVYSGLAPSFNVPAIAHFGDHLVSLYSLLICVPFGVLLGGLSAAMIYGLSWLENGFERLFPNEYLRHMAGMLAVGLLLYGMLIAVDRYYVAGVGYATVLDILRGVLSNPGLLALLFVAKLLATGLTLGSGASGGIFAPSLFMGATLGGLLGQILAWGFPDLGIDPVVFALVGMAGIVGGTTGAVLTAITMIMEQTRDYAAILPIITTVAIAYAVRVAITPENIYTFRLAQSGTTVPQGLNSGVAQTHTADSIMSTDFQFVAMNELREWLRTSGLEPSRLHTVVTRGSRIVGILRPESPHLRTDRNPAKAVDRNLLMVTPETPLPAIMRGMQERGTEIALVTRERRFRQRRHLLGIITSHEVTATAIDNAELIE